MSDDAKDRASKAAPTGPSRTVPCAPAYESLPQAKMRLARGGDEVREIRVVLEVVTPILGGSTRPRTLDEIDVIRAATVRGHLRFWWRALYASRHKSAKELYDHESRIWGRAATDAGGRSAVEIRIDVQRAGERDDDEIRLYDSKEGTATPGAYALWPARGERKTGTPVAPRRLPGTRFRLTLLVVPSLESEVRNALRAWILFGGYGGRTRRGVGSLAVVDGREAWLPAEATRNAIVSVFGDDVFCTPKGKPGDVPWLGGAELHVGKVQSDAIQAWTTALEWLKEFRQGTRGGAGKRAREPGSGNRDPHRPSISNWPEADKIRHLKGKTKAHPPRHNAMPAWPRAGFGLPIIGQFQKNGRNGARYDEPDGFELRWRAGGDEHDRLASPLIVKALPLANGRFVPCALWLNRAYPDHGEVFLVRSREEGHSTEKDGRSKTAAPFDRLVAPGDTPKFAALADKPSLRRAFLDWLRDTYKTEVVAP